MSSNVLEYKIYGPEPTWDNIQLLDAEGIQTRFQKALSWYNYVPSEADRQDWLIEYMKNSNFPKSDIQIIKDLKKVSISYGQIPDMLGFDTGVFARLINLGAPVTLQHRKMLSEAIQFLLGGKQSTPRTPQTGSDSTPAAKTTEKTHNIQAVIADNTRRIIGDLEKMCDEIYTPPTLESILIPGESQNNLDSYLTSKASPEKKTGKTSTKSTKAVVPDKLKTYLDQIKPIYCNKVVTHFQNAIKELECVLAHTDAELVEAYSVYPPETIKKLVDFVRKIIGECESRAAQAKSAAPARKKRRKPLSEIVKDLKFKKEDPTLKLQSILPSTIVECQKLVVYNTKTRVVSYFEANGANGISIKKSSIIGYDPKKSECKKLRKPEKFFTAIQGKGWRIFKSTFDSVKCTAKMSGKRINEDTILYGVY